MIPTLSLVNDQAVMTPSEERVGLRSLVRCAPRFSCASWLTGGRRSNARSEELASARRVLAA
jgi:hypothetical protein